MSAIPPVTGSSSAKREQVEALARLLAVDEQVCIDVTSALAVIPPGDLVRILRAAVTGWESRKRKGGRYSVHVHRPGDPRHAATVEVETSTLIP